MNSDVFSVLVATGADLKRHVHKIVSPVRRHRQPGKKLMFSALSVAAISTALVVVRLIYPSGTHAQTPEPLRFDVASVKVSPQTFLVIRPERSGGRITWTTDLTHFLTYAYHLEGWRVSGSVPGSDCVYEVNAVTGPSASEDQVRLMFQTLLRERFKMSVHWVNKDVDGYALVLAKGGLKITEAKPNDPRPALPEWFKAFGDGADMEGFIAPSIPAIGTVAITGRRVTMLQFSEAIERVLRVPVLDETGLAGKYYFALRFAPPDHSGDSDLPDLTVAVQELGLRLEKRKTRVEILVVDRIEKTPTEN